MSAALPLFLPEQQVTFIHTADWQLGMTRHFLRGDAQARYTAARQEAIGRIGQLAAANNAEFVLVCGDVFEDRQVSSRVIRRSLDHLRQVPCAVYLLPGNHDPMDAASIYNSRVFTENKPDHVHVLGTAGSVLVRPGVQLIAAPWTSKAPLSDLLAHQVDALGPSDDIRILVGHGRVDVFAPESSDPSVIDVGTLERAIADGLIDYVALGDRHSTTQIGDSGRIWYSGAHEVTNYDHREADPGQALVVELTRGVSDGGAEPGSQSVTVTPHQVGQWSFRTLEHDVNGSGDIAELRDRLDAIGDKSHTVVQLALRGSVSITERSDLDAMIDEFTDRFAALTFWELRHDLVIRPDDHDFAHMQLSGFIGDAVSELSAGAMSDGEQASAAQEALALLFRLAGGQPMKLHRLRLNHFRGVVDREVTFADVGVTVVEGANEAGKSSMIEALDLLLEVRSDSKSSKVRAVSPAGIDAGTVVEADITCGPYRFTYTKQYNRGARTELVIHQPAPEQLSGRTAHDKVCSILADEVDASLFKALRLLQSGDPTVGDLAASSALSRALDTAAGTAKPGGDSGGDESVLLDAVRTEYERYFTAAQGRPSRELAAAATELEEASARHLALTAVMELLADDSMRLESLTGSRRDQANSLELAKVELSALGEQWEQARGLQRRRADAQAAVQVLTGELRSLERESGQREVSQKRIDNCDKTIEVTRRAIEHLRQGVTDSGAALAESERQLDAARDEDLLATQRVSAARAAAQTASVRARHDELSALLARVDQVRVELTDRQRELAGLLYRPEDLAAVEELVQTVAIARAQSESAAATLTVTRLGDQAVRVDGTDTELSDFALTAATVVEVDGVVRVSVSPGAESATLAARLAKAERALADALGGHAIDDVAQMRGHVRARERAMNAVDSLRAQLSAILGAGDEDALRAELAELGGRVSGTDPEADDGLNVADAEQQAGAAAVRLAKLIQQTAESRSEKRSFESELRILNDRLTGLTTERDELVEQHRDLCAEQSDELLASRRQQVIAELEPAEAAVAAVAAEIAGADLETLELQHANMVAVVERGEPRLAELGTQIAELRTRIEIRRDDGQLDQLHVAATELESARGEYDRVEVRAQAAKLLLETLERHRDNTRRQYVQPFTDQILRLGKVVFGPTLQVGVDEELRITTRTVGGVTVDHEALSGGAKEQLGIISRLACAMLVDPADGVPVIIDDALGYTDPERLASMGAVLSHAGRRTQVIVLTCTPQRYSSVGGAHLVAV